MSFREFVSNFKYRRHLTAEFERLQNMKPPANPSRRYIEKRVKQLLDERTAFLAHRELKMIGGAAASALTKALDDPRYHRAVWEPYSTSPAPLDATLGLLVGHDNDKVVNVALSLVKSESLWVRQVAALHLASVGRRSTIPTLRECLRDEGFVRSGVCSGIHAAATSGRADDEFRRQAYELLLSQCDQNWGSGNSSARTLIVLDRDRAATDLGDDRYLNLDNRNVYRILQDCNKARILLPTQVLRNLLDAALPLCVGDHCYSKVRVVDESLENLALQHAEGVQAIAESLLSHENKKLGVAAAKALNVLARVTDAWSFVIDRTSDVGYQALTHPQKVYFCAQSFDFEVCNGGLMQFFGNGGEEVADTLDALVELGHGPSVATLAEAIRIVGPLAREPDRELRLTAFEGKFDEFSPAFEPLEKDYYATHEGLRQACLLYAVRHAEHFRPGEP